MEILSRRLYAILGLPGAAAKNSTTRLDCLAGQASARNGVMSLHFVNSLLVLSLGYRSLEYYCAVPF